MYEDPENVDDLIKEVNSLPTLGDVKDFILRIYPTWIIDMVKSYSDDYSYMNDNWVRICNELNTTPKEIIIVDVYTLDDKHTLIKYLCELLTRAGFVIRTKNAIIRCSECGVAIASNTLYDILSKNGMPIPSIWDSKCSYH